MAKTKNDSDKDDSIKKSERKMKKEFKVSDMDDWYDMSENDDDDDKFSGGDDADSENDTKHQKLKKDKNKNKNKRKMKKEDNSDNDDGDDEPMEDSDEGDYDDKEVDYMSDESSSSESEEENKNDLKGVADESAIRDLVVSEEDEEEEEEENQDKNLDPEQNENENKSLNDAQSKSNKLDKKSSGDNGGDSSSDSEFDSENSDLEEPKSALLIQPNKNLNKTSTEDSKSTESSGNKRKLEDSSQSTSQQQQQQQQSNKDNKSNGLKFRHKLENPSSSISSNEHSTNMVKKMKIKHDSGITEDAVRRYLIRKPMTAADLVQKFKNKTARKAELPDLLAEILRKINPEKQNIKGKMYLSLKPT